MSGLKSKTGKVHARIGMYDIVCNCIMLFKLTETNEKVTCKHCLKILKRKAL